MATGSLWRISFTNTTHYNNEHCCSPTWPSIGGQGSPSWLLSLKIHCQSHTNTANHLRHVVLAKGGNWVGEMIQPGLEASVYFPHINFRFNTSFKPTSVRKAFRERIENTCQPSSTILSHSRSYLDLHFLLMTLIISFFLQNYICCCFKAI